MTRNPNAAPEPPVPSNPQNPQVPQQPQAPYQQPAQSPQSAPQTPQVPQQPQIPYQQPMPQYQQPAPQYQQPAPQYQQPAPQQTQQIPPAQTATPQETIGYLTGQAHHVHPSYKWLRPLSVAFVVLAFVFFTNFDATVEALTELDRMGIGPLYVVGAFLLILAVIYLIALLYFMVAYKHLYYVFGDKEFSFYSGILSKRQVHIPYARVQSVNHRASLIQRLMGVCTVSIDTAGGSSNKEVRIPYVTLTASESMRVELFARKAGYVGADVARMSYGDASLSKAPNALDSITGDIGSWRGLASEEIFAMEPVRYEIGIKNSELLLLGLTHDSSVGALLTCLAFAIFAPLAFQFVGVVLLIFFVPVLLIIWAASILALILGYGNFRARRRGSRIEVERGIIQRSFSGIDIDRIQSVQIRQNFLRRIFGYCEISLGRIKTASSNSSSNNDATINQSGLVIHPFVKLDRAQEIIKGLAPEFAQMPTAETLTPLPKVALRRGLIRRCVIRNAAFYILLISLLLMIIRVPTARYFFGARVYGWNEFFDAASAVAPWIALICVVTIAITAVSAVLWAKHSGAAFTTNYAATYNDGLTTAYTVIPRKKIQYAFTRTNPFQKASRVTTIVLSTAAGSRQTLTALWDVTAEFGEGLLDWMKPRN